MPLTIDSALEVGPTWNRQLWQRLPKIPFNCEYSMTSARMHQFHWISHHFIGITLHLQVATDLRRKRFCLVSYHINENATYSMLSRPKKEKIQNLALLQALYMLGQTLYPCWIIPEQLQLGSKHIMTPLNTSDLCFQPSSPTTQDVLTELVCHTLPTPSSVCWLSSENWKASKLALSSKICITSPNFQDMTGLL